MPMKTKGSALAANADLATANVGANINLETVGRFMVLPFLGMINYFASSQLEPAQAKYFPRPELLQLQTRPHLCAELHIHFL
jgi:hypothetical protein